MEIEIIGESAALTLDEQLQLARDEAVIERGQKTFVEVGQALADIRDNKLYRATHRRFENYLAERWPYIGSWRRAYLLMDAAQVVENLNGRSEILPTSEWQVRPLTALERDQQAQAWQRAVEIASSEAVTRKHVDQAVEEIRAPMAVHYTSATPEWYTPKHIIDRVLATFGAIDLDPCSNSHTAPNVPARHHYTREDNGLVKPWHGFVYMNPPYGDEVGIWVSKLISEYTAGRTALAIALVPARTDTAWFQPLWNYPLCFVRGRLKFSDAETSAPFPSVAAYLGDAPDAFAEFFRDIGRIVTAEPL